MDPTIHLLVNISLTQLEVLRQVADEIEADSLEEAASRLLTEALEYQQHDDV